MTQAAGALPIDIEGVDSVRAVVGPNAVIQLGKALVAAHGMGAAREVFAAAGASDSLDRAPSAMVDEALVRRLFRATRQVLPEGADAVLADAGVRTADYVAANRIPAPVRTLLRLLPAPIAGRLLSSAIARHAWTFCGSGIFAAKVGRSITFRVKNNPIATPGCPWHTAVFAQLFRRFVDPDVCVEHTHCCGRGDDVCRFEITLHSTWKLRS